MNNKIIILALEPIDTRYTEQWYFHLPKILRSIESKYDIIQVNGYGEQIIDSVTTEGAFLNFLDTNIWKNNQINQIVEMFRKKEIISGDKFLVTDAWHPGILQIKYISELLDIPVEIHSLWHAGSYDSNDFLGRKIKDKRWSYAAETAYYHASTKNYFATEYHAKLIESVLNVNDKSIVAGFPFDYLEKELEPYKNLPKRDLILFPHRIAPEKNIKLFRELAKELPQYDFVVCQDKKLTKHEYHTLLGQAKMVFSGNLQETLGISMWEGFLTKAIPLVPDRLSYTEMYLSEYKYQSDFTNPSRYPNTYLCTHIERFMENYDKLSSGIIYDTQYEKLKQYFTSTKLVYEILK